MNIIVCIKQVPNTAQVQLDPQTNTLIRQGLPSIINPDDKAALTEALRQKEEKGAHVTVLCMGPRQASLALTEAIALGADEGILLCDSAFAGSDTLATAYLLSLAIRRIGGYDLILCGRQAIDGDTAQVGPELAQRLDIPQISYVEAFTLQAHTVLARQKWEDGYEMIQAEMPCLLTVMQNQKQGRLPNLPNLLKAFQTREIQIWDKSHLKGLEIRRIGLEGSPTRVVRVFTPVQKGKCLRIEGDPKEAAASLVNYLKKMLTN